MTVTAQPHYVLVSHTSTIRTLTTINQTVKAVEANKTETPPKKIDFYNGNQTLHGSFLQ